MKKTLILIVIVVIFIISIFVYVQLNAPFLKHRGEIRITGITLDGKDVLFSKEAYKYKCDAYLKNIETKKETLIKRFNMPCDVEPNFFLSKNRKYLFIVTDAPPYYENRTGNEFAGVGSGIYLYNINNDKVTMIKEGSLKKTTKDYDFYRISYFLVKPSPKEDNKILFAKEERSLTKDSEEEKIYSYKIGSWVYDLNTQEEVLVYEEELNGEYWTWPEDRYQPSLTRWSPDGKAIVYEFGYQPIVGEGGSKYSSNYNYNNKAYIFYLDDLNPLEFRPENVREDVSKCGYYYNNMPKYPSPDGKTYIRNESKCMWEDCTYYHYIEEGESYCKSILD